jgi:hypothetical protein
MDLGIGIGITNFTNLCRRYPQHCNLSADILELLDFGDKFLDNMRPEMRLHCLLFTIVLGFGLAALVAALQSYQHTHFYGFGLCHLIKDAIRIAKVVQEYLLHAGLTLLYGKDYVCILVMQVLFRTGSYATMLTMLLLLTFGAQGFHDTLQMLDRYLDIAPVDEEFRVAAVPTAFRRHLSYIWNLVRGFFWIVWTSLPGRRHHLLTGD